MITTDIIETEKGAALGVMIDLDYRPPPLLIIQAEHGYLACGYISREAVSKTEDSMALVENADTFEDMLKAKVTWVSLGGMRRGVKEGMTGEEALNKFIE